MNILIESINSSLIWNPNEIKKNFPISIVCVKEKSFLLHCVLSNGNLHYIKYEFPNLIIKCVRLITNNLYSKFSLVDKNKNLIPYVIKYLS